VPDAGEIAVRSADGVEVLRAPARPTSGGRHDAAVFLPPGRHVATLVGGGETLEGSFRVDPQDEHDGVIVLLDR
jgi:hypothetical protein